MSAFLYRIVAVIAQQAPPHGIRQDEFLFAGLRKLYGHNGSLTADDGSRAEGRMDHLPATYRTGHQRRRFLRRQAPVPLRGGSSGRGDRHPQPSLNGGAAGPANASLSKTFKFAIRLLHKVFKIEQSVYTNAAYYHGMIVGLCAMMINSFRITSNRESENGRYDVQMLPLTKHFPGFLIEIKAEKDCSEEQLEALAQTALQQINDRSYSAEMQALGIKSIIKYGLAFSGKSARIATEKQTIE